MVLVKHELRQGWESLLIWSVAISVLMAICVLIFPQMQTTIGDLGEAFSGMGSFTRAFGMDQLDFGSLKGYYGIECGNVLGIGGALFAALLGIQMLSKEEGAHTAEFLFSHPVGRVRVVAEKCAAVLLQLLIFNVTVLLVSAASIKLIGEDIFLKELCLLHLAFFLLQLEIAAICFCCSAALHRGGTGLGLGLALLFYFLNLIANITDAAAGLKYVTPFSYTEAADVLQKGAIETRYLLPGMCFMLAGIVFAFLIYSKKDLR